MRRGAALTLVALALMALSIPAGAQTVADRAQRSFSRGVQLQQKGDLEGARQAYEAALKLAPKRVDVLSNLGLVYSQLGRTETAVECFRKALQIEPRQYSVRVNLAVTYMRAGEFAPAQQELATVVNAQPSNLLARNLLGVCLLRLNRLPEGIAQLETARQANGNDPALTVTLASAYIKTNQLDKAEPLVDELKKIDSAEAHFIVGSFYLAKFDHQKAIEEFKLALERNPKLPEAHAQLAFAYFMDFKWDLSVKMCEEELALYPDNSNAVSLLGSLYRQRGRLDEAEVLLEKALHLRPNDYEILYQWALLLQAEKKYPEAATALERVTKLKPDFPPAHITLVRLYGRLERPEDAQREQAVVDELNKERKNQPTVRDKALYDAFKTPQ